MGQRTWPGAMYLPPVVALWALPLPSIALGTVVRLPMKLDGLKGWLRSVLAPRSMRSRGDPALPGKG